MSEELEVMGTVQLGDLLPADEISALADILIHGDASRKTEEVFVEQLKEALLRNITNSEMAEKMIKAFL